VLHRVPMLSLDNGFSDGTGGFPGRVRRFLGLKEDDELAVTADPRLTGFPPACV